MGDEHNDVGLLEKIEYYFGVCHEQKAKAFWSCATDGRRPPEIYL